MARRIKKRSYTRRLKVHDSKAANELAWHNVSYNGMLGQVAGPILAQKGWYHTKLWFNENPRSGHNWNEHTYGDLNNVNNITPLQVHQWQMNKIENLQTVAFKKTEAILKKSGFSDINNFIDIANSAQQQGSIDFNQITSHIYDNLSLIGQKINYGTGKIGFNPEDDGQKILNDVQPLLSEIVTTFNQMSVDLQQSGTATIDLINILQKQLIDINNTLQTSTDCTSVLKNLKDLFGRGGPLNKIKGRALEEMGTARIKQMIEEYALKPFVKNLAVFNTGTQYINGKQDKTDIRFMLFEGIDTNRREEIVKIDPNVQNLQDIIGKATSAINIQAKSGRTQIAWNNSKDIKYTQVNESELTGHDSEMGVFTAYHYLQLLSTLRNEVGWEGIPNNSPYYDLLAAVGLVDKMQTILSLGGNYNTILLTSHGFITYLDWFEERFNARGKSHLMKLQNSITISNFGSNQHQVTMGSISLRSRK